MKKLNPYLTYALLLVVGILIGSLFFGGSKTPQSDRSEHIEQTHTDEEGNIIYTCSMHPSVRQDEPGNCPICGMELIPADDNSSDSLDPNALKMTETALKLAIIQTSEVTAQSPEKTIDLPGKVTFDQTKTQNVTAHFPGRITKLITDFEGAFVEKGDVVAEVYSPDLVSAQQELLEAVKIKKSQPGLYESARKKLLRWEISPSVIDNIETEGEIRTSLPITSPATGYVTNLIIREQSYVNRGSVLFSVADLSTVWVEFEAYESVMNEISEGDNVSYTLNALPGETHSGKVTYVNPTIDSKKQTLSIRAESENSNLKLKPGMLAQAQISMQVSQHPQLLVPKSAILWTGKRSIVFEKLTEHEEPTFIAREVLLGARSGDFYIVHEGIQQGDHIVTNGTFKVDAAAQLADKRSMMNTEPGTGSNATGHDHGEIQMEEKTSDHSQQSQQRQNFETPESFSTAFNQLIDHYLMLKDALVASDAQKAQKAGSDLTRSLREINKSELSENARGFWLEQQTSAEIQAQKIANSTELKPQREAFIELSNRLIIATKSFNFGAVIYHQYCPMANNNKGADWLSTREEIENPYYGDMMMSCGEVIEKID